MNAKFSSTVGTIALVGSGEYLPVMQKLEAQLLAKKSGTYVQIPTAAAPEGDESLRRWVDLGNQQAQRIGAVSVPIVIKDRSDAENETFAKQIQEAGLIYLSGGSPSYLADTLRDTKTWNAIISRWQDGASLAGCSAGAMAIADHIPALRRTGETRGLALLPHIRVLPHFDKMFGWVPDLAMRILKVPDGVNVVGIDENTAIVGGPVEWEVQGEKSAWILSGGHRTEFPSGSTLTTPWSALI